MFSREENQRRLEAAEKNGEFDPIPYPVAMNRPPKLAPRFITPVTWVDAPIVEKSIEFRTIGSFKLVLPPSPLPSGYQLELHPTWIEAAQKIYDPDAPERIKALTFDQLDDMRRDWSTLEKTIERNLEWFNWWEFRPDYDDYDWAIEDTWKNLSDEITRKFKALFVQANPHLEPWGLTDDGIGNRQMAPTLKEALIRMFGESCADVILEKFKSVPAVVDQLTEGKNVSL